ncbi:hypothetical protein TNCV_892321 [Trichonephila clavipes]|nr:hypothetical protein TNCV_892321 [Trichonephila clavipes]
MSQRSHLTDSEAWRVVDGIWNRFWRLEVQAEDQDKFVDGQTTPNEDHYLVLMALRHRNMNATLPTIPRSATGTTVSTQTVRKPAPWRTSHPEATMAVGIILRSRHESVRFGGGRVGIVASIDGRTDLYIIRGEPSDCSPI